MGNWKKNFDCNVDTLFQVGPYVMPRSDLLALGYDITLLKPCKDPWAKKSDYDLEELKAFIKKTQAKAFKRVLQDGR